MVEADRRRADAAGVYDDSRRGQARGYRRTGEYLEECPAISAGLLRIDRDAHAARDYWRDLSRSGRLPEVVSSGFGRNLDWSCVSYSFGQRVSLSGARFGGRIS